MGNGSIQLGHVAGTPAALMALAKREPWAILGIPKDADADQAKRAYRKLARTFHQDVFAAEAEALGFGPQEVFQVIEVAKDRFDHRESSLEAVSSNDAWDVSERPTDEALLQELGLTQALVDSYRLVLPRACAQEMARLKNSGITPNMVSGYAFRGIESLNDQLLLKRWGFTPELMGAFCEAEGGDRFFAVLTKRQKYKGEPTATGLVTWLEKKKLSPSFVKGYLEAGCLSFSEMAEGRRREVSPEYFQSSRRLEGVKLSHVVRWKRKGLSAEHINHFVDAGCRTPKQLDAMLRLESPRGWLRWFVRRWRA